MQKPRVFVSLSSAISRPTPNLIVPNSLTVKSSASGKGLYAAKRIALGETIFRELPLVWVPSVGASSENHCAYCGKTMGTMGHTLRVPCKACNQSTKPRLLEN